MPINFFCNSSFSYDFRKKIDTCLFVQKSYLRNNYIESNIEEDNNKMNQYRIKSLPDPINNKQAASKNYVEILFNDPSTIKTLHI